MAESYEDFVKTLESAAAKMREMLVCGSDVRLEVFVPDEAWVWFGAKKVHAAATRLGLNARRYVELGLDEPSSDVK